MTTLPRTLAKGCFLLIDQRGGYHHSIGGPHAIAGAFCPNCDKALLLHATLDTRDPLLSLQDCGVRALPLLYCMRCALCWYDLSYHVISERDVELLEIHEGERTWDDWEETVGLDEFPRRTFALTPIPDRLEILWHKLNRNEELTPQEELEVASAINRFADPDVGGYPIVDTINQIGGRAFLQQRIDDPVCPHCARFGGVCHMYFLACLQNEAKHDIRITYDGVQIIFFLCTRCLTIKVVHST